MTEPTLELPIVHRNLPSNVSDRAYMKCIDELQAQIRAMGVPEHLNRAGVWPRADESWVAYAWQADHVNNWDFPAGLNPEDPRWDPPA